MSFIIIMDFRELLCGLANHIRCSRSGVLGPLKNTVVFVLIAVVLNICNSTFLAVLIKSLRKRGKKLSWLILPAVVPIVAGVMFG